MESIISGLDYIGYQGPIITSFITFFSLLSKPSYLFMFIIGSLLNHSLNIEFKLIIKEPRPSNQLSYIDDHLIKGPQIYGMPSGHAQIISFAITYLILTKGHLFLILPSIFIGFLTLIQRWKYRRHSINQLLYGSITGSSFSFIIFLITESYLQRIENFNKLF